MKLDSKLANWSQNWKLQTENWQTGDGKLETGVKTGKLESKLDMQPQGEFSLKMKRASQLPSGLTQDLQPQGVFLEHCGSSDISRQCITYNSTETADAADAISEGSAEGRILEKRIIS